MPSPKVEPVTLTEAEQTTLQHWARRGTTAQRLALRSRVVLLAAQGLNNSQIARELKVECKLPANGDGGSSRIDWTACMTNLAQALREPSGTPTWKQ